MRVFRVTTVLLAAALATTGLAATGVVGAAAPITTLVDGESPVTITFRLCETEGVTDLPVDVDFDHVTTVGLPLDNPGFDNDAGWTLRSEGNVRAALDD